MLVKQDHSMDIDYVELVTGLSKMADGKQEDKVRAMDERHTCAVVGAALRSRAVYSRGLRLACYSTCWIGTEREASRVGNC